MKDKMSQIQKELKPFLGKKHTDESKRKISKIHKGKIVNSETREKMRNNNIGKKCSTETKLKMSTSHQKIVFKIINDNVVHQWESPLKASLDIKIPSKSVQYYCRKKDKTNKYNLIYKEDYDKINI